MENSLLELKSSNMRLAKEASSASSRAEKAEAALSALQRRSRDERVELEALQAERRLLLGRMRQAEAKAQLLAERAPEGGCRPGMLAGLPAG